jgi:hypothetical protein
MHKLHQMAEQELSTSKINKQQLIDTPGIQAHYNPQTSTTMSAKIYKGGLFLKRLCVAML